MSINVKLSSSEEELVLDALREALKDKEEALAACQSEQLPLTARDFGIPQLQALVYRIESSPHLEG